MSSSTQSSRAESVDAVAMRSPEMRENGSQLAGASNVRPRVGVVAAVLCAGVAVVIAAATALVTFGLSESYGFGPLWDTSAFVMTVAAAALTGTAVLAAVRLARVRLRPLPVVLGSVAGGVGGGGVAGAGGDSPAPLWA